MTGRDPIHRCERCGNIVQVLHPGDRPEAAFTVTGDIVVAREYCNLHGHWKALPGPECGSRGGK